MSVHSSHHRHQKEQNYDNNCDHNKTNLHSSSRQIDDNDNNDDDDDIHFEPLGYQHFLYDVNIEFSKGGNQTYSECNSYSFKLKYLPYMIQRDRVSTNNNISNNINNNNDKSYNSSIFSINTCDQQNHNTSPSNNIDNHSSPLDNDHDDQTSSQLITTSIFHAFHKNDPRHVDVTKETCAFLSNSDYVPNYQLKYGHKRVVHELISAKLSQETRLPPNLSNSSLVSLAEQQTTTQPNGAITPLINRRTSTSPDGYNQYHNNLTHHQRDRSSSVIQLNTSNNRSSPIISTPPPSPSPSPVTKSSKRFVNYTILIKTIPGLDKHPTVIERRFSDFLELYQSFKSKEKYAKLIEQHVNFPKKVYMGNFSSTNIAERSIEFMKMLSLCMSNIQLLWSTPFISFLLDKELKEAHRLSLFGDPDDVQATIETCYYIQQKLYHNVLHSISRTSTNGSDSSICSEANGHIVRSNQSNSNDNSCPQSPNHVLPVDNNNLAPNESISANIENDNQQNGCSYDSNISTTDSSDVLTNPLLEIKRNLGPLNQRLLVTFCILFLTYYRGENYDELKLVVGNFNRVISSQEYVESMLNTRHYITLRACLLFLMNICKGDVINETQRLWLKRRLEDIDGAHADLNESLDTQSMNNLDNCSNNDLGVSSRTGRVTNNHNTSASSSIIRVTKGDLTSLIRDRNFCSF